MGVIDIGNILQGSKGSIRVGWRAMIRGNVDRERHHIRGEGNPYDHDSHPLLGLKALH